MIRTLEDYITSDAMENEYNEEHPFVATEIPLDDKKVIELFHGTEILGIKPEDIDGCKLGCLEFQSLVQISLSRWCRIQNLRRYQI